MRVLEFIATTFRGRLVLFAVAVAALWAYNFYQLAHLN